MTTFQERKKFIGGSANWYENLNATEEIIHQEQCNEVDLRRLEFWNNRKAFFHVRSNSEKARMFHNIRLDTSRLHIPILNSDAEIVKTGTIRGKPRYYIVCSRSEKVNGKIIRAGSQSRYQCYSCMTFSCRKKRNNNEKTCWELMHEEHEL